MSKLRRRLLKARKDTPIRKSILARKYQPKGEAFLFYNDTFSIDEQTIFADITLNNTEAPLQCVFDVGLNIIRWQDVNTFAFHNYFPVLIGNDFLRSEFLAGSKYKAEKMDTKIADFRLRIAINANGYYYNGINIANRSTAAKNATEAIIDKIREKQRVEVGSIEGENRSFALYNEVSIYHGLLSEDEMIKLTTKGVI